MGIIPTESKWVIDAFLAQDPDDENLVVAVFEAKAYEVCIWPDSCGGAVSVP